LGGRESKPKIFSQFKNSSPQAPIDVAMQKAEVRRINTLTHKKPITKKGQQRGSRG
jgi:hypothetical protein